jgi:hypothetical protein
MIFSNHLTPSVLDTTFFRQAGLCKQNCILKLQSSIYFRCKVLGATPTTLNSLSDISVALVTEQL